MAKICKPPSYCYSNTIGKQPNKSPARVFSHLKLEPKTLSGPLEGDKYVIFFENPNNKQYAVEHHGKSLANPFMKCYTSLIGNCR